MPEETHIVELPESLRNGVYANFFGLTVSEHEAIIDFASSLPEPPVSPGPQPASPRALVVSRVIVSVEGARKLRDLLDDLLKQRGL